MKNFQQQPQNMFAGLQQPSNLASVLNQAIARPIAGQSQCQLSQNLSLPASFLLEPTSRQFALPAQSGPVLPARLEGSGSPEIPAELRSGRWRRIANILRTLLGMRGRQ